LRKNAGENVWNYENRDCDGGGSRKPGYERNSLVAMPGRLKNIYKSTLIKPAVDLDAEIGRRWLRVKTSKMTGQALVITASHTYRAF
jgi:hypothetical protein